MAPCGNAPRDTGWHGASSQSVLAGAQAPGGRGWVCTHLWKVHTTVPSACLHWEQQLLLREPRIPASSPFGSLIRIANARMDSPVCPVTSRISSFPSPYQVQKALKFPTRALLPRSTPFPPRPLQAGRNMIFFPRQLLIVCVSQGTMGNLRCKCPMQIQLLVKIRRKPQADAVSGL